MALESVLRFSVVALTLAAASCTTSQHGPDGSSLISSADVDISKRDTDAGKTHFEEGNYGLAEKHFRKAVELRADNGDAWLGLAASYDRLGRFELADRAYEQALKVAGRTPKIVNNMGYSRLLRGDRAKAKELLEEALVLMPGDPVVLANLDLLRNP